MIKLFEDMVNQPAMRVLLNTDKNTQISSLVVETLSSPPENVWVPVDNSEDELMALNPTVHKLLKSLRLAATIIFANDTKVGYKSSKEVLQTLLETVE